MHVKQPTIQNIDLEMFRCDASSLRGLVDTEATPPLLGLTVPSAPRLQNQKSKGVELNLIQLLPPQESQTRSPGLEATKYIFSWISVSTASCGLGLDL